MTMTRIPTAKEASLMFEASVVQKTKEAIVRVSIEIDQDKQLAEEKAAELIESVCHEGKNKGFAVSNKLCFGGRVSVDFDSKYLYIQHMPVYDHLFVILKGQGYTVFQYFDSFNGNNYASVTWQ